MKTDLVHGGRSSAGINQPLMLFGFDVYHIMIQSLPLGLKFISQTV